MADLSSVDNLTVTDLRDAKLNGANLFKAKLNGANLAGAILCGVNLEEADLTDAVVDAKQQLAQAKSLKGATMPDGTKHD